MNEITAVKRLIIEQTRKLAIIKMIDPDSQFAEGYAAALLDVAEAIDPAAVAHMRNGVANGQSPDEILNSLKP